MLSAFARPYIEASVPVLREHGLAISRQFYADLFAAHPEQRTFELRELIADYGWPDVDIEKLERDEMLADT